jgi:hypothetical protein
VFRVFSPDSVGKDGMIEVDIRAPSIPQEQRVWRLFPGSGYQFLDAFIQQGVGFLDFPGLELPKGNLNEAKDLVARIVRSEHIAATIRELGVNPKVDFPDVKAFTDRRASEKRGRNRQAIINFYQEAKANDFVIIPEPMYLSNIWVGQIKGNDTVPAYSPNRYGRTRLPARRIDWIKKYRENSVSSGLSMVLRHQHPFTILERSVYLEVFSLAYGSFVYGDRHAATVYNDESDFLDSDAALLGVISRPAAAACKLLDEGKTTLPVSDIIDVLLRDPPIEYTCSQEVDIHSAGFNRYTSVTIVSLVIATITGSFLGLSQQSSKNQLNADIQKLTVSNSAPGADPQCTARVSEASKMVLNALGIERTWALCQAARAAKNRAGLRSSASPKPQVKP